MATEKEDPTPTRSRYHRTLSTIFDVKTALAELYRALEKEEIDPGRGKAMIYCAQTIANLIKDHEMEERMGKIEERLSGAEAPAGPN